MKKYLPIALALAALVTAGASPVFAQPVHHRAVRNPALYDRISLPTMYDYRAQLGGPGSPDFGISGER